MALVILEGLDRTGKSSVAASYVKQGYQVIHLSAPSKKYKEPGYTGPSYLDDMIELVQSAASRDLVLDRSHYGELIWPSIYGRDSMLSEDDIDILREIEDAVGVTRILMHDPELENHWKRCVDNKEPLTRTQFLRARVAYERMATKYGFDKKALMDMLPNEVDEKLSSEQADLGEHTSVPLEQRGSSSGTSDNISDVRGAKSRSREQVQLAKANAINDVLSKRIVKGKGDLFDEIESEVRTFLNKKLGTILGNEDSQDLSKEEILVLKTLVRRVKEKEVQ